jgi:hypothetical protein
MKQVLSLSSLVQNIFPISGFCIKRRRLALANLPHLLLASPQGIKDTLLLSHGLPSSFINSTTISSTIVCCGKFDIFRTHLLIDYDP